MLNIQQNYDLQKLNTLACPSVADFFCAATSLDEIKKALYFAAENQHQVRIIGEGSNILACETVKGLVIQPAIMGKKILAKTQENVLVEFGAGENWHECVLWANRNNFYGLENLALIPGKVGAAPIQNIGAYGVELEDVFETLSAINIKSGMTRHFSKSECEFAYRESIFKGKECNRFIITSVTLRLHVKTKKVLTYPALLAALSHKPFDSITPEDILNATLALREAKLPNPKILPNAGSFFKNPIITKQKAQVLKNTYPELVTYDEGKDEVKIPAAWLIDKLGWKGKDIDGVVVHSVQALVLTNPKHLPVSSVLQAAQKIQKNIKQNFNIELEIEPRRFGAAGP